MKFTEGAFRDWGYEVAREEFREKVLLENELDEKEMSPIPQGKFVIKDRDCRCDVSADPLEA
jgi:isocitrate dehydrogenase